VGESIASLRVYYPDEISTNNTRPSLICNNIHAFMWFLQALHRGIEDFENTPIGMERGRVFRVEAMEDKGVVGKAQISVYHGTLRVHSESGKLTGKIAKWYEEAMNEPGYGRMLRERREWERNAGLEGTAINSAAVEHLAQLLLDDPAMARHLFDEYLEQLQRRARSYQQ
jgi:hypothetical protein